MKTSFDISEDSNACKGAGELLCKSEEMHRVFFEMGGVGMAYGDLGGRILHANAKYSEITGYSLAELTQLKFLDLTHPDDLEKDREAYRLYLEEKRPVYAAEKRYMRKDGSVCWVSVTARMVRDAEGRPKYTIGIIQDITERKRMEEALLAARQELEQRVIERTAELNRANRALLMLKECDGVLMRAKNEADLLNGICQVIVETGEVKMASVGFAENDEKKSVRPVAFAGADPADMKAAGITWAEEPRGNGPTGTAIRTRKAVVCPDIANEPSLAPWRIKQLQHGYASLLALPLVWKEDCLGALTIYSGRLNAFSPQEVDLLKKMASNLASGIIAQRNRIAREKLQKELLEISEREKQLISQELHDGLCQNLAGTALMSRMLYTRLEARNDPDTQYAKEIYDLLGNSVNEARNLSHGLHPVGPHGEGLMNALAQLAGTVRNLFHIDCTFECPRRVTLENETVSTHLFRITQEAINNARKHGEADRVVISLRCSPKGVTLTIEDNGVGFPVKMPKKSGMGLRIMKHRTTEIGATLSVRRAGEDGGTVVTCTLPHRA